MIELIGCWFLGVSVCLACIMTAVTVGEWLGSMLCKLFRLN